jgi:hypothetical protein
VRCTLTRQTSVYIFRPGYTYQAPLAHEHAGDGNSPYESLVYDSMGFSSMNLESVWSMFPEAYCVNFPCELKITSAISQSQRMLHSDKNSYWN